MLRGKIGVVGFFSLRICKGAAQRCSVVGRCGDIASGGGRGSLVHEGNYGVVGDFARCQVACVGKFFLAEL